MNYFKITHLNINWTVGTAFQTICNVNQFLVLFFCNKLKTDAF